MTNMIGTILLLRRARLVPDDSFQLPGKLTGVVRPVSQRGLRRLTREPSSLVHARELDRDSHVHTTLLPFLFSEHFLSVGIRFKPEDLCVSRLICGNLCVIRLIR